MKKIILSFCLTIGAIAAIGADVRLAWDKSDTASVTNYVFYAHTNSLTATNLASAAVRLNAGTNLTARVERLAAGRWWFVVTAVGEGMESDPSNTVTVEVPEPPKNMRTVILQFSGTLSNFYDVGFFRLRLP